MPRRLPPAQTLHAFEVAARHMSFTAAARELGITQAAVSQRIRVLEHQLGQALFIRHARGLELTEAGRAFLPAARESFQRLATGIAEAFGPARDAPLTVRATPAFVTYWLAPRLPRFQTANPGTNLRLTTAIWPTDFDTEDVDLEVRYGHGDWHGTESLRLTRDRLTPVCSPRLARDVDSVEAIGGHTLLHTVGFDTGWPQWLAAAGRPGLSEHAPALLCDTLATVMAFTVQGCGIAMGRSGLVDALIEDGRLVAPFDLALETEEVFHLTRPAGRKPRPEAAAFWDWLQQEVDA